MSFDFNKKHWPVSTILTTKFRQYRINICSRAISEQKIQKKEKTHTKSLNQSFKTTSSQQN